MCNLIIYEVPPSRVFGIVCNCQFCSPKLTRYVPFVHAIVRDVHVQVTIMTQKAK